MLHLKGGKYKILSIDSSYLSLSIKALVNQVTIKEDHLREITLRLLIIRNQLIPLRIGCYPKAKALKREGNWLMPRWPNVKRF